MCGGDFVEVYGDPSQAGRRIIELFFSNSLIHLDVFSFFKCACVHICISLFLLISYLLLNLHYGSNPTLCDSGKHARIVTPATHTFTYSCSTVRD